MQSQLDQLHQIQQIQLNECSQPLSLCKSTDKEKFWLDDPKELYQNDHYTKFIPKYEMTRNEQLNAITRFCIYAIIIIIIFTYGVSFVFIPIVLLILVVIFYKMYLSDPNSNKNEFDKIINTRKEKLKLEKDAEQREYHHDGDVVYKTNDQLDKEAEARKNYTILSGYYDADNELYLGKKPEREIYKRNADPSLFTVDEILDYKKNACRAPTTNNPFMNPDVTEFGQVNPPVACNADDDDIKENINVNFNHELFRDVDELFDKKNSQRQFYTIPNTAIPNNQTEFAQWLYNIPSTCKEDQNCLRYDDLRTHLR